MSLIVEDGTGKVDSESYESATDFMAYATLYGVDIPDEATAEIILRKSMDYLESQNLSGTPASDTQALHYPASFSYINGKIIDDDIVPKQAIKALNEIGLALFADADPYAIQSRGIKQDTFGPFTTIYDDVNFDTNVSPRIDIFISPLLEEDSGSGFRFGIDYRGV